jgi:hypothetical protein
VLTVVINSILHLLLPLAWLGWLAGRKPKSWGVRVLNLMGSALYVAFWVIAGPAWGMLGWYTRSALLGIAVPLWLVGALRARGASARPRGFGGWASASAAFVVSLLMATSLVQLAHGVSAADDAVDIQSPFPAGTYLVIHGGENEAVNHHVHVTAQRHALDITALNAAGFRARGLAPERLADYVIYGTPLRSPCAGEVLFARDGEQDLPLGPPDDAPRALLGNTVLIHCTSDITVVLAHLQTHSVRVAIGDRVEAGSQLGAVGNSGNTSEPHLHLHAVRGRVADPKLASTTAEPVRLRIDGHLLTRNDRLIRSEAAGPPPALAEPSDRNGAAAP